jgi:hypothetical protein
VKFPEFPKFCITKCDLNNLVEQEPNLGAQNNWILIVGSEENKSRQKIRIVLVWLLPDIRAVECPGIG